jgi:hypothetical protein
MTTQEMLDERYGRRRSTRSRVIPWVVVCVLAVAAVAVIAWISFGNSANSVSADATSYDVVDARSVTVSFQLTAPADSHVVCVLEADDEQHGIVGWRVVEYPSVQTHSRTYTETIPTVGLATTGLVNTCWVS